LILAPAGSAGDATALGCVIAPLACGQTPTTLSALDHRECRIGRDFLLIYQVADDRINCVRAGTHSALFSS